MRALALLVLLAGPAAAQGRPGDVFRFGATARALGLAGAYSAVAEDATALYYNPGGLGLAQSRSMSVMHAALFEGASYDYLGYAHPLRKGALGVQALRLAAGDLEARDSNNQPTGGLTYGETGVGLGYGLGGMAGGRLSSGFGLKALRRSLGSRSNTLIGLDAGARWNPHWLGRRVHFGFAAQNALSLAQGDTADRLPMTVSMGAAVRPFSGILVSLEGDSSGEVKGGVEYEWAMVALRVGYEQVGPSFGGGLRLKDSLRMDVAVLNSALLGTSARFSLGWRFAKAKVEAVRKDSAIELLVRAENSLKMRDYGDSVASFGKADAQTALPPSAPSRKRYERLRELSAAAHITGTPEGLSPLPRDGETGRWAHRAVAAYVDGQEREALVLAAVAAGVEENEPARRLLKAMEGLTFKRVEPSEVAAPAKFVEVKMAKAEAAFDAGRLDESAEACRDALIVDPASPLAHERLGSIHFQLGRYAQARQEWEEALRLAPDNTLLRDFMNKNLPTASGGTP